MSIALLFRLKSFLVSYDESNQFFFLAALGNCRLEVELILVAYLSMFSVFELHVPFLIGLSRLGHYSRRQKNPSSNMPTLKSYVYIDLHHCLILLR